MSSSDNYECTVNNWHCYKQINLFCTIRNKLNENKCYLHSKIQSTNLIL